MLKNMLMHWNNKHNLGGTLILCGTLLAISLLKKAKSYKSMRGFRNCESVEAALFIICFALFCNKTSQREAHLEVDPHSSLIYAYIYGSNNGAVTYMWGLIV